MAKKSLLPKSRAKTAYGLLSEVRKLILAEPQRYTQERYIAREGGEHGADCIAGECYPKGAPACGTVGCVAGWVATLKHGAAFAYSSTPRIAASVLGLDYEQADELFSGGALRHVDAQPQTKKYARAGAKHIAAFQKQYADQLKRKAV